MNDSRKLLLRLAALAGMAAAVGPAHAADAAKSAVDRMYVLECGESKTSDVSANWSPGVDVGVAGAARGRTRLERSSNPTVASRGAARRWRASRRDYGGR